MVEWARALAYVMRVKCCLPRGWCFFIFYFLLLISLKIQGKVVVRFARGANPIEDYLPLLELHSIVFTFFSNCNTVFGYSFFYFFI